MKKIIILLVLLLFLTVNCKKFEGDKTAPESILDTNRITVLDTIQLKLNDGAKWIANVETHNGVKHMDTIISVFKKEKRNDYKVLGDSLSKQTGYIIKNCSMKGEPHDQLHVVLVPMLDEITILRDDNNTLQSKTALERLEQLVSVYFMYFKV